NTLRNLAQQMKLDVVEFPDCRGEGFAAIRAKRLLNEFPNTKLIVRCHAPLSLLFQLKQNKAVHASMFCDFELEDYAVRHADLVTAPSRAIADYFQKRVGRKDILVGHDPIYFPPHTSRRSFSPEQVKTVRFFGPIEFASGADVFVEAALQILAVDPGFRFELHGSDTGEALFGKSYGGILLARIPEHFKERFTFAGSATPDSLPAL